MFKLNEVQRTNKGEKLLPIDVQGEIVYCLDRSNNTVMRKLADFDFTPKKPQKQIVVAPVRQEDELFEPQETTDNELIEVQVSTPQPQGTDQIFEPEPEPTPEPTPTPEPEPEKDNTTTNTAPSGSIWSQLGDEEYI